MSYAISNRRNLRHLESLTTERERLEFMTGGRVTVARVSQVVENRLVHYWVAKIRGIVIGGEDGWLHDTPERAREFGKRVMQQWKDRLLALRAG